MSKHNVSNIGWLDEEKYKKELWHHRPLTDFWQIGKGIERRLNKLRIYDMYDLAHSNYNRLFKEFGINAELLIDHSYGKERLVQLQILKHILLRVTLYLQIKCYLRIIHGKKQDLF